MKALRWLTIVIGMGLLLVGCQSNNVIVPATNTTTATASETTPTSTLEPSPLPAPTIVSWDNSSGVGPGVIEIGDMRPGAVVDTWVEDITLENGYCYKKGEPLCITLYNDTASNQTLTIALDNGNYGQPVGYRNWISLSTWNPTIPAYSAMNVPIRLRIPQGVTVPIRHQWEFRFEVIPEGQGNIRYANTSRVVVTMR